MKNSGIHFTASGISPLSKDFSSVNAYTWIKKNPIGALKQNQGYSFGG